MPLWLKLGLTLAIVIIVMRAISFVTFHLILEDRLRAGLVHELEVHASELDAISQVDRDGRVRLAGIFSDPRYSAPSSGFYWQIDIPGQPSLRSRSLEGAWLGAPPGSKPDELGIVAIASPDGPAMMLERVRPLPDGRKLRFAVATSERVLRRDLDGIESLRMIAAIFWSAMLIPLVLVLLWMVSSPLRDLRREIDALDGGHADRISGKYPSDIQPVANRLNQVLDSYRGLADHARLQAASLAHNVRSVMVATNDEVERLERKYPDEPGLSAIRASSNAIQRYIESHARRADRPLDAAIIRDTTRVETLLEYVFDATQRLHREKQLEWDLAVAPDCEVQCNRRDLGEMLFSLLDNAGRWARHRVHCGWRLEGGYCLIEIDDDGPGFGANAATSDKEPEGLGLGLEIARELAASHGGNIETGASPLGGARVTIRLPQA